MNLQDIPWSVVAWFSASYWSISSSSFLGAAKRADAQENHEKVLDKSVAGSGSADKSALLHDQRAPTAVPLDLLNPEFIEKKNAEDEILESGGSLTDLAANNEDKADGVTISSARITQMIETDRQKREKRQEQFGKKQLQEDGGEDEDNLTAEKLKVTFHTADSFDRLDSLSNKGTINTKV